MTHVIVCDVCRVPQPLESQAMMFSLRIPGDFMESGQMSEIDVCTVDCLQEAVNDLRTTQPEQADPEPEAEDEPAAFGDPLIPQRGGVPLPPEFAQPVEVTRRS